MVCGKRMKIVVNMYDTELAMSFYQAIFFIVVVKVSVWVAF